MSRVPDQLLLVSKYTCRYSCTLMASRLPMRKPYVRPNVQQWVVHLFYPYLSLLSLGKGLYCTTTFNDCRNMSLCVIICRNMSHTCRNMLQSCIHVSKSRNIAYAFCNILWYFTTFCDILQHSATFYDILQHSATFYDILRHFATNWMFATNNEFLN